MQTVFFILPYVTADSQAVTLGSFFLCDRFKSKRAVHIYHSMTPGGSRGPQPRDGLPIGSVSSLRCQCYVIVSVYI